MGKTRIPQPVKLVVGFIFRDDPVFLKAKKLLQRRFGALDFESAPFAFMHTGYYAEEFGSNLMRRFISFKKLIPPQDLAKIKIMTNKIEGALTRNGRRLINIDPGYLDAAKLVLASTKDYRHRIYLDRGIYAEITIFYQAKSFRAWEWTYPDYRSQEYIEIFNCLRGLYVSRIQENK